MISLWDMMRQGGVGFVDVCGVVVVVVAFKPNETVGLRYETTHNETERTERNEASTPKRT